MGSVEVVGSFGGRAMMYPLTEEDSQLLTISSARTNCLSRAVRMGELSISTECPFGEDTVIWYLSDKSVSVDSTCTNNFLDEFLAIHCRTTQ